jgi:chromosomal replication initiation ATPase DnaA
VQAAAIWQQSLLELQHSMDRVTFEAHIQHIELKQVENNVWTLQPASALSLEWLERRLKPAIEQTLTRVSGQPVTVQFVVSERLFPQATDSNQTTTLSSVVLQVGQFHFEGNIIPASWFEHLTYKNGKPNTNAIIILSEIVYWYRPIEVRDERTGQTIGYRKKFKFDKLQRSYQSFAAQFGFSRKQVRDAIQFLADDGVITKELRDITADDGTPLSNVLFLEVVPAQLKEITYSLSRTDPYDLQVTPSDL